MENPTLPTNWLAAQDHGQDHGVGSSDHFSN